ncbi:hypothetical protein, partial [Natrinema altunense]|uniref:hypothetical protein n=1 Tax=Natrinema altunense TaxID=222984 RepID=UPI001F5C234D
SVAEILGAVAVGPAAVRVRLLVALNPSPAVGSNVTVWRDGSIVGPRRVLLKSLAATTAIPPFPIAEGVASVTMLTRA